MNLKLIELVVSSNALKKLANIDFESPATSFKIAKGLKEVSEQFSLYEEQKNKLLIKYGKVQDDKITYTIQPDTVKEFQKSINELHSIDISINFEKLDINVNLLTGITASEMLQLENFINIVEDVNDDEDD